jgi:hypothetical protein
MATFTFRNPGSSINAAAINEPFTQLAADTADLSEHAFGDECVNMYHLEPYAIDRELLIRENTGTTAIHYGDGSSDGNSWHDITHNTSLTETTSISLVSGDVMRVEWFQKIYGWTSASSTSYGSYLKVQWNIGSGYVDAPFMTQAEVLAGCSVMVGTNPGDGFRDQENRHVRGCGIYIATGNVTVSGVKLVVNPSGPRNNAADQVKLRQGMLIIRVTER